VHEAEELVDEDVSIAAELRELEGELELDEDDVIDERPLEEGELDGFAAVPDAEGFELLGPVTTEDIVLPKVPLFASLSPEAFIDLGHAMVFQRAEPGQVIFEEGEPGDSCIVVSRGQARAVREHEGQEVVLMELGEGDFAGLFALLASQNRHAKLVAETHLEYFEIDRIAIDRLLEKHPAMQSALKDLFRERLLLNLLAILPVFTNLPADERQALCERFKDKSYEPDDELFYSGYEHDGLWVILEGKVRVQEGADGDTETIVLVPGDYLGSFAGSGKSETVVTASAVDRVHAALLTHAELSRVVADHPDFAGLKQAFRDAGLMLTEHVFAGNGRLPGGLVQLRPVFDAS
jgi:CRP-like cAMP-binding protein